MEKMILWGCGGCAEKILLLLDMHRFQIVGCVDRKADNDKFNLFAGYRVCSPKKLDNIGRYDFVLITSMRYFDSMLKDCIKAGIKVDRIRYYDFRTMSILDAKEKYSVRVYSQVGEEIYLRSIFGKFGRYYERSGFYVDVGAHHPCKWSNTMWAYESGWHGINIEPNKQLYELLCAFRPRDVNINVGISDKEKTLDYYAFTEPAYNTCSEVIANDYMRDGITLKETYTIPVRRLCDIFDEYNVTKIDFLNIDTEGFELQVLNTVDFSVEISVIMIEQHCNVLNIGTSKEYSFLKAHGYEVACVHDFTVIYERLRK